MNLNRVFEISKCFNIANPTCSLSFLDFLEVREMRSRSLRLRFVIATELVVGEFHSLVLGSALSRQSRLVFSLLLR